MLATNASRPAIFSETMRRVRLEKESVKRNCPARLNQLSGRCQPLSGGLSSAMLSSTKDDEAFSVFSPESGGVRSSNGWHLCRLTLANPTPHGRRCQCEPRRSGFLETVTDPVERFDHFEVVVDHLELLAQPLDVAVDGAIVDINPVVIGGIHQRVSTFHHTWARRQRLQDQEFGHR